MHMDRIERFAADLLEQHRDRVPKVVGNPPFRVGLNNLDGVSRDLAKRVAAHNVAVEELVSAEREAEAAIVKIGQVLGEGTEAVDVAKATEAANRFRFDAVRLRLAVLRSLRPLLADLLSDLAFRLDLKQPGGGERLGAKQAAAACRERIRINSDPRVQEVQGDLTKPREQHAHLAERRARLDGAIGLVQDELVAAWRAMGGQGF